MSYSTVNHAHLFSGVVAQGLMQYLSVCHIELVWRNLASWLETIQTRYSTLRKDSDNGVTNLFAAFFYG